jgi:hypothetical protein
MRPAESSKVLLGPTANADFAPKFHVAFNAAHLAPHPRSPVLMSNFCAKIILAVMNRSIALIQLMLSEAVLIIFVPLHFVILYLLHFLTPYVL